MTKQSKINAVTIIDAGKPIMNELNEQDLDEVAGGTPPVPKSTPKDSPKEEVVFEYGGLLISY
jgi:hypothetical protein